MPASRSLKILRQDAQTIFESGINAVKADQCIYKHCRMDGSDLVIGDMHLDLSPFQHIHIIGGGKATGRMAAALEELLGERLTSGLITVKYGHTVPLRKIRTIEAGHPVPDQSGCRGAAEMMTLAGCAGPSDLIICLLSGGGSALLPLPAPPVTLAEKQETIRQLLACGASIGEINAIRKHISLIKGGQLAKAAYPATLLTLILSDVVGDRLDVIASGPSIPDSSSFQDCIEFIRKYKIAGNLPESVWSRLERGAAGKIIETPRRGDAVFSKTINRIIGNNVSALNAARDKAESLGYSTLILSSLIEGDTGAAARFLAAVAKEIRKTGNPLAPPACILFGGETTVQVTGSGLGGRNQEFALISAIEIEDLENTVILSGGTDGTDGPTDAAGAVVDSATIRKAREIGIDPAAYLENNDSYHFFSRTGELLITGPTGTNVMDLQIILAG